MVVRSKNPLVPTEDDEQIAVVQWCQLHGLRVHHSPNEMGGSTSAIKARAIRMKRLGTSKGFPDLLVFVPIKNSYGDIDAYQPLAIEMKRVKGSTTSTEQKAWIKVFELAGIPGKVCKGAGAAIAFIEEQIKQIEGDL